MTNIAVTSKGKSNVGVSGNPACPTLLQLLDSKTVEYSVAALEASVNKVYIENLFCNISTLQELVDGSTNAEVLAALIASLPTPTKLDYVKTNLVPLLNASQVQLLSSTQLDNLTNTQLDSIVGQLVSQHIQALTNSQLSLLSTAQLNHITTLLGSTQMQLLSSTQLDNLTNTQLDSIVGQLVTQHIQALTTTQVNMLTVAQRNKLDRLTPLRTGQTTSYATGDDGNLQKGRYAAGAITLDHNNQFGNTNRFTDSLGTQVYANGYVIDHATGLGWLNSSLIRPLANWATAQADANTYAGLSLTGWRLPNVNELLSIRRYTSSYGLDALQITEDVWTSTVDNQTTTQALILASASRVLGVSKTLTKRYVLCRNHY